jgi:outer membrane protein OmpA-like peptidoglycan-associated protein
MTNSLPVALWLAFVVSIAAAGNSLAADTTNQTVPDTAEAQSAPKAAADDPIKAVVEEAIEKGNDKLAEEADRVPGLKYDDISRVSNKIPGRVQVPDPTSNDYSSRAISVPGGLVSDECKHFARGFLAKRLMTEEAGLSEEAAMAKIVGHLHEQRVTYAKLAGKEGLKRSVVALHDAECPVCGPLNAAEIACHKAAVKNSPIRELVMFDFASDVLRGGYLVTVQQIKSLLETDPGLQVALIGRASIPGGPVPNFTLSAKRITSVWNGLAKADVPVDRIVAIPIGEDEPHIDLQLALEYGLDGDFATYGQQPLNQSVYMVVFRPNDDAAFSSANVEAQNVGANGDELEQKRQLLMEFLGGEIKTETVK